MRALTEDEMKRLFDKLAKYIGPNTTHLLERKGATGGDDGGDEASAAGGGGAEGEYVFRLHNKRIWYMPRRLAQLASCVANDNLCAIGVLFAKVQKSGRMQIVVTALDYLAQYSVFKVWVKPNQEQQFVYGSNITRAGLGRITEGTPQYQGAVVFSMSDIPLGFGVAARSTQQCRKCEMNAPVLFHEADIGQYLRDEERLTARDEDDDMPDVTRVMQRLQRRMLRLARGFGDYNFRTYFVQHVRDDFAALQRKPREEQARWLREHGVAQLREMQRMVLVNRLYTHQPVVLDARDVCARDSRHHDAAKTTDEPRTT